MFVAGELEFNAMTKYFYTDRTVPKKRLSKAEMVEINGLYRIIGQDERALFMRWSTLGLVALGSCLGCLYHSSLTQTHGGIPESAEI